ncbi:sensor histidine kinase [Occallatibacter riparius]|uniref:histidine kinase n=1 Tax=Occallatibacter riparius TaxID=1002689 RepID=A0A9J7BTV6_9BACT|nr:ATP-binding protein [Occallatibacter riparius]UWZ86308.1 ATP-binding protein [Occallatibacter riparius]
MPEKPNPRLRLVFLFAAGAVLVAALFGALQAFNTSHIAFLTPDTSGETLAFFGLTVVLFLLLIALLMLLLRNLLKLSADQGSSALGARLRTRMVLGAALIAVTPATFMFLFSFFLMNRTIDRWFSPNTTELRDDSIRIARELAAYVAGNARSEATSIAASGAADRDAASLRDVLNSHRQTLQGGFVVIYSSNRTVLTTFAAPPDTASASIIQWLPNGADDARDATPVPVQGALYANLLNIAQRDNEAMLHIGTQDYALGKASTNTGIIVIAALPMPQGLSQTTARIRSGATSYWQLFRMRKQIRSNFFLLLLVVTVFVFFSGVWLALFLSKQITRPVAALADAMNAIAAGRYEQRIELLTTGELAELVRSFNHMAADLETSRQRAASSSAQLTRANQALEERRRELEIILETIPNGVVTLDGSGLVLQANRAFAAVIGHHAGHDLRGERIESLLPQESLDEITTVIRRSQRMGSASTELEPSINGRKLHLAVTSARLDIASGKQGTVLVVEDTSELLRVQRQLAWKEVAQRVAHEIKNPLTPIALSAERITRHLDRYPDGSQPDSLNIIRKCSEIILGSVGTLRTLVDQFSALAQFPAPRPRPCDLNRVAEEALALFAGRMDTITVTRDLAPDLPLVMADHDAIRRALANLIDNAAEAMQGSLLRELCVSTAMSEDGSAVEITVSDTGHGINDEIRERLFLPFYSTKHRGTGLGLSIAAKIVQEHGGSIRAESNAPKGARFLLRIPLMDSASDAEHREQTKEIHS